MLFAISTLLPPPVLTMLSESTTPAPGIRGAMAFFESWTTALPSRAELSSTTTTLVLRPSSVLSRASAGTAAAPATATLSSPTAPPVSQPCTRAGLRVASTCPTRMTGASAPPEESAVVAAGVAAAIPAAPRENSATAQSNAAAQRPRSRATARGALTAGPTGFGFLYWG